MYDRYLSGRGGADHEVYTRTSPSHPSENQPKPEPDEERQEDKRPESPKEGRPGLFKGGSQIGEFLRNLNINLDTGDILLMIIIVFLLMESDDEEIIIVLALVLLFGR